MLILLLGTLQGPSSEFPVLRTLTPRHLGMFITGTEHVNCKIQLFLSVFCINNPSSWVAALKKAEFIYNNCTHANRTQTPFELWYGQAPRAIPTAFDYLDYPKTKECLALLQQW